MHVWQPLWTAQLSVIAQFRVDNIHYVSSVLRVWRGKEAYSFHFEVKGHTYQTTLFHLAIWLRAKVVEHKVELVTSTISKMAAAACLANQPLPSVGILPQPTSRMVTGIVVDATKNACMEFLIESPHLTPACNPREPSHIKCRHSLSFGGCLDPTIQII